MTLPVPNLDDRRFQQLVDDAKRLVQQRCPEWTDHNVSDPGVTLIETFAWMTDQLLYRLNRVPERNYIKFLELIGVRLFPPTAARSAITFWLSAPQPETVTIPAGTQVATVRTETEPAIIFSTLEDLEIVTCELGRAPMSQLVARRQVDHSDAFAIRRGFRAFNDTPKVDDVLLLGLDKPVPACAIRLEFECETAGGQGIVPGNPPWAWEAWTADGWSVCRLEEDTTGGLNHDGSVTIHVPRGHVASDLAGEPAALIRVRVSDIVGEQRPYSTSPQILTVSVSTVGGTTEAANSEIVRDEVVGKAEGVPGGRLTLRRQPVVASERPLVVEVDDGETRTEWTQVPNFAASGRDDRHFVLDEVNGVLEFGPAVRLSDGSLHNYGAVPPKGAVVRVPEYQAGGGTRGNVAARRLSVLKSSIPYVSRVENAQPARGGVDAELVEAAKRRGPIAIRTRDRAVTAEDFEYLCREAAPEIARVRCVTGGNGAQPGVVTVLVVPAVATGASRFDFTQLLPSEETLEKITRRLDQSRIIGTRLLVEVPVYRGVAIEAELRARDRTDRNRLKEQALEALYRYFHATQGGPDGTGWPFGRPVQAGEVYAVLQQLPGAELVQVVRLYGVDPITRERGKATDRLHVEPHALVYSDEHKVVVEGAP